MSDSGIDAQHRLDAWRAQGADRADPLRFARIDALARRASAQQGAIRRLLDERLAGLVAAYAEDLAGTAAPACQPVQRVRSTGLAPSAMTALLEHVRRQGASLDRSDGAGTAPAGLAHLDDVRRISTHVRAESQLREALEAAPENAGPLNSASLVHRALTLMRATSPEYLQPFMAYVDALAWMEGMGLNDGAASRASTPNAGSAKRPRAKGRSRRA